MKKLVPHFRRSELYFEWGRSPEGEEGEQYSHVRGRTPVFIYEPPSPIGDVDPGITPSPLVSTRSLFGRGSNIPRETSSSFRACLPAPTFGGVYGADAGSMRARGQKLVKMCV